jgi:hypothetical protein
MRSQPEIKDRIRSLMTRKADALVLKYQEPLPHKCTHNYRHPLDTRKKVYGESNDHYNRLSVLNDEAPAQTIGLCMLGSDDPKEWAGAICEEPIDARRCPYFTQKQTKQEFLTNMEASFSDLAWLEQNAPEMFELLWVVDAAPIPLPWWKRLWLRLRKQKPLELEPSFDPLKLLPEKAFSGVDPKDDSVDQ